MARLLLQFIFPCRSEMYNYSYVNMIIKLLYYYASKYANAFQLTSLNQ